MLASSWRSLLNLTLIKRDIRSASAIRATLLPLQSHIHSYMPTEFMSDFLGSAPRPVEASIKEKLTSSLQPQLLQVINESHMHAVPKNSETHFKVWDGVGVLKEKAAAAEIVWKRGMKRIK